MNGCVRKCQKLLIIAEKLQNVEFCEISESGDNIFLFRMNNSIQSLPDTHLCSQPHSQGWQVGDLEQKDTTFRDVIFKLEEELNRRNEDVRALLLSEMLGKV